LTDRNPRFNPVSVAIIAAVIICGGIYALYARTITDDLGGNLHEYKLDALLEELRGQQIRIDGVCGSACGVFLRNACAANLLFTTLFLLALRPLSAYLPAPLAGSTSR
jgi:amino acid transporter